MIGLIGFLFIFHQISSCRFCLEKLADLLVERDRVSGDDIRTLVEECADADDLQVRAAAKDLVFM